MDTKIKNYLGLAVIAALFLFAGAAFSYVSSYGEFTRPQRSFSVSGEGRAITVPDVAELSFGVLTEGGKNLADLQRENTERVNRVISFLKENGVDKKDIKTEFYSISPRYQYFSCPPPKFTEESVSCPPSEIVGYSINESVSVKIRDLNRVGDAVSGVVERGANTVSGPTFTVDDPSELENQARAEAVTKARKKAEAVAEAAGVRLGKLISLNEGFSPPPLPFAEKFGLGGGGEIAAPAPAIEPGSQEIRVNVMLTYELR